MSIEHYIPTTSLEAATKKLLVKNITRWDQGYFFESLLVFGCKSGVIAEFAHSRNTDKFYDQNKDEISKLLSQKMYDYDAQSPGELFGSSFNSLDPLCVDSHNKQPLAYFAFEETTKNILEEVAL